MAWDRAAISFLHPRQIKHTLTPAIAKELAQRVVVCPNSRLEVQLNCRDELEEMLTEAHTACDRRGFVLGVEVTAIRPQTGMENRFTAALRKTA